MNKKIRFSLLTLLVMLCGTVFADDAYYTLDTTSSNNTTNNAYASTGTTTVGSVEWVFEGNGTTNPWRLGGKSLTNQDRVVYTTSVMDAAISSVKLEVGAASNITVNSLKLIVASDAAFLNVIDEVSKSFEANSVITFSPTSPATSWAENAYYKFVFNVSVSGSNNKFVEFKKVEFYKAASSEPEPTGYTVDFNTAIATSSHDFAVASKWKHIVEDNDGSYVGYKWDAAFGTGEPATGGLLVYSQKVGSSSWDMANVYDLLVTPKVSGTIKLKVKAYENASSSTKAFVQLYSLNGAATAKAEMLKEFQTEIPGYSTGNGDWVELTYDVTESQRIGIRAQYVYMDDFYAEAVDTTPEAALVVSSVMDINGNSGTQGTNPIFEQQADGTMKVVLKVTLTNTGDIDFVAGTTSNYTLTPAQKYYGDLTYYEDASIAIPEDIAVGESKTFNVEFTVPYVSGYKYWYVKENVTGTTSTSYRYATSVAYESKFILRVAESGSTSDLTTAQDFGRISAAETRSFEIYNDGTAPLTIKSITLPEGFTSDNLPEIPSEGLVLAKKTATAAFNVTLPVTTTGDFSGNLVIKYVKAGDSEESTKTLAFSGTVLAEGTWFADFNGDKSSSSAIVYPAGSIVESSTLTSAYTGSYGSYDHYLKSYNRREANKFITPKLHATAGATLKFDAIKYQSGNDYDIKVYVSTDRKTWGEAKMTVSNTDAQFESTSTRYTQTLTFDAEGDYYVAFDVYGMGLDNIIGLTKVAVAHDMYIKTATLVAEAQTGSTIKPKATIVPLTDETAESYTVRYYVDDVAVAQGTAVALTAKADATTDFTISYTPNDEVTTTHDTYIEFEFTDGTKIATEHQTLKVTNEPKFLFVEASTSVNQYTTNLTKSQAFGKTNKADTKAFKIYNQGTAVLQITGITAPEGFSVNKTGAFEVAAGASEEIIVTFSATTPGEYKDSLIVNYTQEGAKPYKLEFTGTMLDAAKWYANFDNPTTNAIIWPAGSVYESSINTSYSTYSAPYNYYIYSRSATKNKFTTPKLTAAAGDVFSFDAKAYNSYNDGKVKVYASATRDELGDPVTDLTLSNTDWATQNVTIANAGDYYITIEFSDASLDEIYGLKPVAVAHDLKIASSSVPATGMQNNVYTAKVNLQNFGLKDETATDYTMTVFVNGEAVASGDAVVIPMNHKLDDAGTAIAATFRYPKVGTFPVYVEVKAGDYSVKTAPVDVTFAEEVAVADAIAVGTKSSSGRDYGFVDWYNNDGNNTRYTDILYPAAKLTAAGIKAGDKINSIAFRASNSSKTFKAVVTSWVGTSTGEITFGSPVKENMQEISIYNGSVEFPANFESVITLTTPIVWDGTSDIRVYTEAVGQGSSNYVSANYDYDSDIQMSYNGTTKAAPLAYFTLALEPATYSGTVKNAEGAAVEGATVTLVSNDGEGVEYTGTTNAEGAYSIKVIQANRYYNVEVEAEGYDMASAIGISFAEGSVEKDFVVDIPLLKKYFVNTDLASTEGWTAVTSESFKDFGTGKIGEYKVRSEFSAATVDEYHPATAYAFGFEARWSSSFASYTQESKVALPAGTYTLNFDVENVNGSTTKAAYENRFTVKVGDKVYTDESTEWMNGKSNWTNHSITFDVTEDAKATLSFGYGTGSNNFHLNNTPALYVSNLNMTFISLLDGAIMDLRAEIDYAEYLKVEAGEEAAGLVDLNAAIEAAKALLSSTDAAAVKAGIETLKAAETAFLTANLPVAEGTYYVYNPLTQKFLSRGNAYGTSAMVDDYGVAINVTATDLATASYKLSSFDNGAAYGFDTWMYADAGGDNVRTYNINKVERGFTMTNTTNSQLVYVYLKEDGNKFRVAGNAIKDDNYDNDAQTIWQFITKEDRDAIVARREAAEKTAAYTSAGISENAQVEVAEPTLVSFTSGHAWTQTVTREQGGQPATNDNGTEMWQATGNYTQTIKNVPTGLYKISIQAFYRNGSADECVTRYNTGYNTVLAYLEANGNKVLVKSWATDKGEGNNPNSMGEAKAKFDEGKYLAEIYAYVGADSVLSLTVNNPAHIGNGWFIVGNVKYAKVEEAIIAGDANLDKTVTTSDAVAAVNFALEKEIPSEKAFKAADVNKSNSITVSDAVGIVNIALGKPAGDEAATARGEKAEAVNYLTMSGASLNLTNSTEFVGFQMDITLADGAQFNGVQLADRAADLQVIYNRIANNTYRIIAFSTGNAAIEGNEGELFSLDIAGNNNINITNIEFADAAAQAYALGFGETTGINGIYAGATNVESYTVGGVKNDKVRKGMNVVRTADGKVKKIFVK